MEEIQYHTYRISRMMTVQNLCTAHFFTKLQQVEVPIHRHNACELVFCERGQLEIHIGAETYTVSAGQMFFCPPNVNHGFNVVADDTAVFALSFVCSSRHLKLLLNSVCTATQAQHTLLRLILQELFSAFELEDGKLYLNSFHPNNYASLGSEQMVTNYLESLLINLLRGKTCQEEQIWTPETLDNSLKNKVTTEIKVYIAEHLGESITLDMLAENLHYSRSNLTSQFRRCTGMSIMEYVLKMRISRAKQLLGENAMSVSQIADSLGFSGVQYFSQCFRQAVGTSPSAYRDAQNMGKNMR